MVRIPPLTIHCSLLMDFFTVLESRASSLKLKHPGPSPADLERILLAGVRAPDHGKLAPWRFVVLEESGREMLADAMVAALKRRMPEISTVQLDAERQRPLRAPTIIVVATHPTRDHKVPVHEQTHAVAAAVE